MANTQFSKWVEVYGQSRLAKSLKVTRQLTNQWVNTDERPSDAMKIKIVALAGDLLDYNSFFKNLEG